LRLLAPFWEPLFGHGVSHQQKGTSWVMLRRIDYFNPAPVGSLALTRPHLSTPEK
jgi:hypothetical protein